jgi:hypothetical protein
MVRIVRQRDILPASRQICYAWAPIIDVEKKRRDGGSEMAGYARRPEPKFDWFIPIDGDGIRLGTLTPERPPTFEYLREVVQTAERLGFYSLLIPTRFVNGLFDEGAPLEECEHISQDVLPRLRAKIAARQR